MTDRDELLKRALELEISVDNDENRRKQIRSIRESLSEKELQEVEDEARVRTMIEIESAGSKHFMSSSYSLSKNHHIREVIGEWYIDQQKPIQSRVTDQVEV
jgi:hypothetical protein